MSTPLSCWVVSDGRRGIENQALGLAEALATLCPLHIDRRIVSASGIFKAAQPGVQYAFKSKPEKYGFAAPFPHIAIGCGRQAIAPLRALKKACGTEIFTIYVQNPRVSTTYFDVVLAPEHDQLVADNVLSIIGSPNRVTNERIIVDTLKFEKMIATRKTPRVTMLIGGNSKTHKLDQKSHKTHIEAANKVLRQGHSLMITSSRRTPDFAVHDYQKLASGNVDVWFEDGRGDNPYFAMLGASDAILVTEDSTNMLTEACATGKPVFRLPMTGAPGKFSALYQQLSERCNVEPYSGVLTADPYSPLKETERAAKEILTRIAAPSSA